MSKRLVYLGGLLNAQAITIAIVLSRLWQTMGPMSPHAPSVHVGGHDL